MTFHWTILSNELTQKLFCPIGTRPPPTSLNQAVLDPNVPHRTGSSDICKNG